MSISSRVRTAAALLLVTCLAPGCARPYRGPKTLAAIGAGLVAGGGATWAIGERQDRGGLITPGFVAAVVGVAAVIAAGGWMATQIACDAEPDCPDGEECREVPAPPGGIPYKQCVPRVP